MDGWIWSVNCYLKFLKIQNLDSSFVFIFSSPSDIVIFSFHKSLHGQNDLRLNPSIHPFPITNSAVLRTVGRGEGESEHWEGSRTGRRGRPSGWEASDGEMECMNEWMNKQRVCCAQWQSLSRCRDTQLMSPLEPLWGLELVNGIDLSDWAFTPKGFLSSLLQILSTRCWHDVMETSPGFRKHQ